MGSSGKRVMVGVSPPTHTHTHTHTHLAVGKVVQRNCRDVAVIGPQAHGTVGEHPQVVLSGVEAVPDTADAKPHTDSTPSLLGEFEG